MTDEFVSDFSEGDEMTEVLIRESLKHGYGRCGNDVMAGHGGNALARCGTFKCTRACKNEHGHEFPLVLRGEKKTKGMYRLILCFYYCYKIGCPKCFRAWAYREALSLVARLSEGEKRFGKIEHLIISSNPSRRVMDYKEWREMRKRATSALLKRGVVGAVLIHHGFRLDRLTKWWKPYNYHWHCLGIIGGGFKCRDCSKHVNGMCMDPNCREFLARCNRLQLNDKFLVKVAEEDVGGRKVVGERRSLFATSFYQLTHASYRLEQKRAGVVTWIGKLGYRKFKTPPLRRKLECDICHGTDIPVVVNLSNVNLCKDKSKTEFRHRVTVEGLDAEGNDLFPDRDEPIIFSRKDDGE